MVVDALQKYTDINEIIKEIYDTLEWSITDYSTASQREITIKDKTVTIIISLTFDNKLETYYRHIVFPRNQNELNTLYSQVNKMFNAYPK